MVVTLINTRVIREILFGKVLLLVLVLISLWIDIRCVRCKISRLILAFPRARGNVGGGWSMHARCTPRNRMNLKPSVWKYMLDASLLALSSLAAFIGSCALPLDAKSAFDTSLLCDRSCN